MIFAISFPMLFDAPVIKITLSLNFMLCNILFVRLYLINLQLETNNKLRYYPENHAYRQSGLLRSNK